MHRHCPNSDFVDFEKKLDSPNQVFFQNRSKRRPSAAESLFTSVHKNNIFPIGCTKLTELGSDLDENGADSASELIEHGFPVSSPSGVEPAGPVASVAASSHMT